MTEETRTTGMDPADMWRQWYETGSRMWSEVMQGNQESYVDPWGLYRQWFEGLQRMQGQMIGSARQQQDGPEGSGTRELVDPQEMWGRWFEATVEGWQKAVGIGTEMLSMAPRLTQLLDETRENLMGQERASFPKDPLEFAVQWYNASSGPFSEFVQDVIEREEFLDLSSRYMQNYASLYKIFSRNSEEYLSTLQLPTRSDITRVAGLIVALEDKVDRIEEALEDFEYGYAEPATAESVQSLEQRVDRIEGKLDQLLTAVEGISTNGSATTGSEAEAGGGTEESGAEEEPQEEIKATNAARRKAQEMGVDLSEVEGTGADGQITVGDVREKGEG